MTVPPARLEHRGPSVVLTGAYRAGAPILVGDSLRSGGDWLLLPTTSEQDDFVGYAFGSAQTGEEVDVIIGGLARTSSSLPVRAGDALSPDAQRGRSRPAAPGFQGRRIGVAIESKPAGRPFWVQVAAPS